MSLSIGRWLRIGSDRPKTDAADRAMVTARPAAALHPLVDVVAYAEDCILTGRVRLSAERVTDMLIEHDTVMLLDLMVEMLDGTADVEVKEVLVKRDEILVVQLPGPRGDPARRHRTRQDPVKIQLGRYQVVGDLHTLPGLDPVTSIRQRAAMVPLTDAWIEFDVGPVRRRQRVGAIAINCDHVETIALAFET